MYCAALYNHDSFVFFSIHEMASLQDSHVHQIYDDWLLAHVLCNGAELATVVAAILVVTGRGKLVDIRFQFPSPEAVHPLKCCAVYTAEAVTDHTCGKIGIGTLAAPWRYLYKRRLDASSSPHCCIP